MFSIEANVFGERKSNYSWKRTPLAPKQVSVVTFSLQIFVGCSLKNLSNYAGDCRKFKKVQIVKWQNSPSNYLPSLPLSMLKEPLAPFILIYA